MSVGNLSLKQGSLALLLFAAALAASPAAQAADVGMRVVKDPVTGQLRAPTAEEFQAMQEQEAKEKTSRPAAAAAAAPMVERRAANGAVGMQLNEDFMTYSVVKRNADGTITTHCVTGAEAATKLLKAPQASTAKEHGHAHQ